MALLQQLGYLYIECSYSFAASGDSTGLHGRETVAIILHSQSPLVILCSQRSTRACWDDHFEHIPCRIAEEQHINCHHQDVFSVSCLSSLQIPLPLLALCLLYVFASILLNPINPSIQFHYYQISIHIKFIISTNDCHVHYIYHIARLHRNCCEKKMICWNMELCASKLRWHFFRCQESFNNDI